MVEWTEKYRPRSLGDIIGNPKAREDLKMWAESWAANKPKKPAVVLIGDPGIGKTTAALALANDMGWQVLEMNASDTRNAEAIKSVATMAALGETFTDSGEFVTSKTGGRKLIILDEADNVFGREDHGGIKAIAQTLVATRQPIILIVNDWYELKKRSSVIESNVMAIKFQKPKSQSIVQLLRSIARAEGIEVSDELLFKLAERSGGDVRSAVKDLQSLAEGRTRVEFSDIAALGERDVSNNIFKSVEIIFETQNCRKSRTALGALDEDPESMILWIDHNLPLAYRDPRDMHAGFEALSRADIFISRVKKRQYYGLWGYAGDMLSCGVSMAKGRPFRRDGNFQFPKWLVLMSRSKRIRDVRDGLAAKMGKMAHTSIRSSVQDVLPQFKQMYNQDMEFRLTMTRRLNLTEDEIGFLMDAKPDSHPVKHVLDALRKVDSATKDAPDDSREEIPDRAETQEPESPADDETGTPQPTKDEPKSQKSLMDFG